MLRSAFPQPWPVPATEKPSHSMMLPPPCFTVGMVLDRWWAVPGFLQTWLVELRPNGSILVSLDQRILFLTVWESFRCIFQTPSGLSCVFHWGEASVCPLCHKAQISGVLQWCSKLHLTIMEATVLLGTFNAAESFCSLPRSVPQHNPVSELCRQFLWPHGLVFVLICIVSCVTLYRQVCAFQNQIVQPNCRSVWILMSM